ncbi:trypsin-like peptidase domain-containing protein [Phormidium sp. FACHB-592]|uniref:Trypsin-like serine protease n=1 Tax=Stenomitos frigidus AS-A4 TaxID=2933935 RepID=A0ABV0KSU8_9CYAN|nr:trypsin-like peptidase domain-containing protein [Phormidium sp. FACHB-592]MBD2077165.1 trypsin-like peptidase domain-containing protein [Phormidium sp. FACHB-592]
MKSNSVQKAALLTAAISATVSSSLGFLPGTLPQAKALVVGQDNRVTPDYNWLTRPGQQRAAFGKLESQRQDGFYQSCSFAVVGPNLGLTNAHCVMDEKGHLVRSVKAYAARHGKNPNNTARSFASANVDRVWKVLHHSPSTPNDFAKDWAIIRFTTNLGNLTGSLGNEGYGDGGRSMMGRVTNYIGYPNDWPTASQLRPGDVRGSTPAQHAGCRFIGLDKGVLFHDCDTAPGTSGSNMYTRIADNHLRLMGINSSSGWLLTNGQRVNGAVPLDAFMPMLRQLRQTGGR